jgi:hypothetical protein
VLAFRDDGADSRFYDIDFRAMGRDPLGCVAALYGWLGERVSADFAAGMREWWAASGEAEPNAHPDPAEFGLDLAKVRPLFADYMTWKESRNWN